MANSITHGARSTANQVLAGIDLTRKCIVVTGCTSGIGFVTMNALAANGAHVIGLAKSWVLAKEACDKVGLCTTPVTCDLADLHSIAAAGQPGCNELTAIPSSCNRRDSSLAYSIWLHPSMQMCRVICS